MSGRRRGYRELQADAARGTVTCPRCNTTFTPGENGREQKAVALPDGFPALTPAQIASRLEAHRPATDRLHEVLRTRVGPATFQLWLARVRLVGADGDTLYAVVPAEIASWTRDRFGRVIDAAASELAGRPVTVLAAPAGGAS